MQIAIAAFENMAALDAIGPFEVLAHLPDATLHWVGLEPGVVRTEEGAGVGISRRPSVRRRGPSRRRGDPGRSRRTGPASERAVSRLAVRRARNEHVDHVGVYRLAPARSRRAARGKRATSHWLALGALKDFGAEPTLDRVVVDGKVITAAGVSSGIDMALTLAAEVAGEFVAQTIQLGIEYDPQPPFDAGSPLKAPRESVEFLEASSRFILTGSDT